MQREPCMVTKFVYQSDMARPIRQPLEFLEVGEAGHSGDNIVVETCCFCSFVLSTSYVLKVPEAERVAALKRCGDEEYSKGLDKIREDTLSNTYHGIPAKPECVTVPAPCDAKWRQTTYVEQSWFEFTAGKQFCHVFEKGAEKVTLTECLKGCEVERLPPKCTASVYQHAKFEGNVATFSVGEYEHDDFVNRGPLRNDKASSIKVQGPPGCKATVYEKDHFEGWKAEFPVGNFDYKEFLGNGAKNDQASSIKVTLG